MKILLQGLGHLADALIQLPSFQNLKPQIFATTTTPGKRELYPHLSLTIYELSENLPFPQEEFDWILLNTPPREGLVAHLEKRLQLSGDKKNDEKWVFISSTSVYGVGGSLNEKSPIAGSSANAEILRASEEIVLNKENSLVIRPGGLVDLKRHPKNFFRSKDEITKANHHINYIHTTDLARFIVYAVKKDLSGVFNLVAPKKNIKRDFYQSLGLEKKFVDSTEQDRIISCEKVQGLGFEFLYPDLLDYFSAMR